MRACFVVGAAVLSAAGALAGCSSASDESNSDAATSLAVVEIPTPPLGVPRVDANAIYPQVRGDGVDLRAVNATLRETVLADERAFRAYARKSRKELEGPGGPSWALSARGRYQVKLDRKLVSASTVVVSALLPAERATFAGQSGRHGWLSVTARVPSGRRVTIDELFSNPPRGVRVLAQAWRRRVPRPQRVCVDAGFFGAWPPTSGYFRSFALTPRGLAVGVATSGACSTSQATVPYATLRPYLSTVGAKLIAGVRRPR